MKHFSAYCPVALMAILLLAFRLPAAAQAPAWQSARAIASATTANNYFRVSATAVDGMDNVYLAGYFANSVVLGGTTLTSAGNSDLFVAKFNLSSNQFVWAQRAGGADGDYATALAVSGTGVYVAGGFPSATADFGPITLTRAGTSSTHDVFVVKLTDLGTTGSFVWAQQASGIGVGDASALAVSGTSVYVAGYFGQTVAYFGPVVLTNAGALDVFVAKLTDAGPTGSFVWAQQAGGTGMDVATALAVSGTSVYVTGSFASPQLVLGSTTLTNMNVNRSPDVFVTKLTDAGGTSSFEWTRQVGGLGSDAAAALTASGTSVYVAGSFGNPTADFGTTTLTSAGNTDVFVTKLTDLGNSGSFQWSQRAGGAGDDASFALAVSGPKVYVSGAFLGATAGFGTTTLANPTTSNAPLGFVATLTDPTLTATAASRTLAPAQLYPNPARHTANLHLPAGTTPAPLTLADALGRSVRRYPAPAGSEAALDLRGLPPGLYLLRGAGPAQRLVVE